MQGLKKNDHMMLRAALTLGLFGFLMGQRPYSRLITGVLTLTCRIHPNRARLLYVISLEVHERVKFARLKYCSGITRNRGFGRMI